MEFTGERFIPGTGLHDDTPMAYEHWQRYLTASKLVKGKVVLDIACGEGYGSNIMAKNALHVYGVDISTETVEHASAKYIAENLTFKCGSVERLEFDDESIDVIVSFETIEHVDEITQKAFLNEAKRVLKKDGILLISCPNKKVASDFAWDIWQYRNEFHVKEYYIEEFYNLLQNYFLNVQLFFQRYEIALLLSSFDPNHFELLMSDDDTNFDHAQNIIALCSNSAIQNAPMNSIVLKNQTQYLKNIQILADVTKHNENLNETTKNLRERIIELESLNLEVLQTNINVLEENIKELEANIKDNNENLKKLELENREVNSQKDHLQMLADELQRIYNTRSWRMLNKAYKLKKMIFHKK